MSHLRSQSVAVAFVLASAPVAAAPFGIAGTAATAAGLQPIVDVFRNALGPPDNLNNPGPLFTGHREINWDGGGATNGTAPVTPFTTFLNTRGGLFTTPGTGLEQSLPAS